MLNATGLRCFQPQIRTAENCANAALLSQNPLNEACGELPTPQRTSTTLVCPKTQKRGEPPIPHSHRRLISGTYGLGRGDGLGRGVGTGRGVTDGRGVAVAVGVGVGVALGVTVGVTVGVGVGVAVGVAVGVTVGVGVGVGPEGVMLKGPLVEEVF